MGPDKKKALEAAGWKFGSVEEFLGKAPMSDDQMRSDFEQWAKRHNCDTIQAKGCEGYWLFHTQLAWMAWQAAYAAGRKAERETMQLKNWDGIRLGTTGNQEGER